MRTYRKLDDYIQYTVHYINTLKPEICRNFFWTSQTRNPGRRIPLTIVLTWIYSYPGLATHPDDPRIPRPTDHRPRESPERLQESGQDGTYCRPAEHEDIRGTLLSRGDRETTRRDVSPAHVAHRHIITRFVVSSCVTRFSYSIFHTFSFVYDTSACHFPTFSQLFRPVLVFLVFLKISLLCLVFFWCFYSANFTTDVNTPQISVLF